MPKDRERAVNPAAAQRKAEKQKALKKGKAAVAAQRTERLAHRNPDRLQRQIDDLKALEASAGGKLSTRDRKVLGELERDVGRVRKAREAVGEKGRPAARGGGDDSRGRGRGGGRGRGRGGGLLGKRGRDWEENGGSDAEGSETDDSVRNIPMPRDTPPPIPAQRVRQRGMQNGAGGSGNPNMEPLGECRGGGEREAHALPAKPPVPVAQITYEAKPAVRDLRKEAVSRFMPAVVKRKMDAKRGDVGGKLLEEEELEKLEMEGYGVQTRKSPETSSKVVVTAAPKIGDHERRATERDLEEEEEEEERFRREMRNVQMEEVEDEDL